MKKISLFLILISLISYIACDDVEQKDSDSNIYDRLIKVYKKDSDGNVQNMLTLEYNREGQIVLKKELDERNNLLLSVEMKYDIRGLLYSEKYCNSNGTMIKYKDYNYWVNNSNKTLNESFRLFDQNYKQVEEESYRLKWNNIKFVPEYGEYNNDSMNIHEYAEFLIDDQGNVVRQENINKKDDSFSRGWYYRFNTDGKVIEFTYKELDVVIDHYTCMYNDSSQKVRADHTGGKTTGYESWEYNDNGKVFRRVMHNEITGTSITYEYVYGPGGITEIAALLIDNLAGI